MPAPITDSNRGLEARPSWATEPPVWGELAGWDKVRSDLEEIERKKPFRFASPDGSIKVVTWTDASAAKAWASIVGHRYLGGAPSAEPPTNRGTGDRGLSPPPLVQADIAPRSLEVADVRGTHLGPEFSKRKRKTHAEIGQPVSRPLPLSPQPPRKTRRPVPPTPPEKYTFWDEIMQHGAHTTMTDSMILISDWFGWAGKGLQKVPGLQGVGRAYEAIGQIAGGLNLVYELIHEVNQAEALEKGSKELIKRTKPVKRIAEALLKKKYPKVPEAARKKAAEYLEKLFEKYGSDPAIKEGRRKVQELDESKDLDKTLFQELKKLLEPIPGLSPTP